jgi:hypothetical protein
VGDSDAERLAPLGQAAPIGGSPFEKPPELGSRLLVRANMSYECHSQRRNDLDARMNDVGRRCPLGPFRRTFTAERGGARREPRLKGPRERFGVAVSGAACDCVHLLIGRRELMRGTFKSQPTQILRGTFADQSREDAMKVEWRKTGVRGQLIERLRPVEIALHLDNRPHYTLAVVSDRRVALHGSLNCRRAWKRR